MRREMKKMGIRVDMGQYLHDLRLSHGYSLKKVADYINVDISLLSKIEHGERQLQRHMLGGIAEIFNLDQRELQIKFLNDRIEDEFGDEPYLKEAMAELSKRLK
jgi:transcriptional regulator with XRE-family HTH domain